MFRPTRPFLTSCIAALTVFHARAAESSVESRFGVMTHFAQGWDPVWADIASMRGVNQVRDELYWNQVETQPGVYSFPAAFDRYMASLSWDQISPMIVLDFENPLYDGGSTPYSDAACTAFGAYTQAVLQHYGTQIQAVEVWNEFNGSFCQGPATGNRPAAYAKILQSAYASIKAQRPDVIVAGGATAGVPLPYWEALMKAGALASMDALSIHPYRYNSAPEGIESDVASLQALVKCYNGGRTKPIWVSEIGWQIQSADDSGTLAIDETTQAKFLVRAYALLLSAGVQRVYWYDLHDDVGVSTMGLTAPDATPRQAAYAYQVMTSELAGAALVGRETTQPGLYSVLFQRSDGTEVRVLWATAPTSLVLTGATKAMDMVGNPTAGTGSVWISDSPIFIEGPMKGLPAAPAETVVAEAASGFSGVQGQNGWWYGDFVGSSTAFELLPNYSVTDWSAAWGGQYPYVSVTPSDQHPSTWGCQPVSVVRRWVSTFTGTAHLVGSFQTGTGGDGVGVTVLVNQVPVACRQLIGGASGQTQMTFDVTAPVAVGSTIDFAVDPGPATDIDFDATNLSVTISQQGGS